MTPYIGIIGGSGLYQMEGLTIREERTIETPYGPPSDAFRLGELGGVPVAFLARHGRHHAISPSEINFRANMWALKSLGVEQIVSVSAVGSMKEAIQPGHLVLIDQFIDRTQSRPSTFFHDGIVGHVSFADPICGTLAARLADAATSVPTTVHRGGTYVCIEGPMFSSRAESRLYRSWNVDVIGMTNYQEAKLAREAEICFATIALATDYDCWHQSEADVDAASVVAVIQQNVRHAQHLIRAALPSLPRKRDCACAAALRHAFMRPLSEATPAAHARLRPILQPYVAG
ncbi:MAG: S-methyl-5'-thioadenosine phosphorylase [Deltaproteobacteria bacterium]|nr:S-methyl-5'-thioadenosine phosphorylase [Deltaproteobacteria bacterium]